jgi:hypothetical protein
MKHTFFYLTWKHITFLEKSYTDCAHEMLFPDNMFQKSNSECACNFQDLKKMTLSPKDSECNKQKKVCTGKVCVQP